MSNHRRPHDRQTPRSGVGRRRPRTITAVPGGTLPRWVRDEITRSTPKDRRAAAIRLLADAAEEFADRRFRQAVHHLQDAKALAPRSATIRELLGLSSYNLDRWDQALRELRAFRRLSGETIHMRWRSTACEPSARPARSTPHGNYFSNWEETATPTGRRGWCTHPISLMRVGPPTPGT
jgi:hypothetical protein